MTTAALPGYFEPLAALDPEVAAWGYKLFRHIRSGASGASSPTLGRTLDIMLVVLQTKTFGHPMPQADLSVLVQLAESNDWEGCYEREQAEQDLGPEDRHLREQLLWLRQKLPGWKAAIDGLSTTMERNGFASWDDAKTGEKIWATYLSAVNQIDGIETRLRSRIDTHKHAAFRAKRIDQIFTTLLSHYAGRGPQYDVTCRTLATVTADIEAARRPGVQATEEGVDTLRQLVLLQQGLVNQLQKFTESTKVDTMDGEARRELAEAIATCALRRVINTQPELASQMVQDMKAELIKRGVPGVQAEVEITPLRQEVA